MKVLSLVALAAAVAYASFDSSAEELRGRHWHAKHMPQYEEVTDKDYELNKEYLYEYNGQLMTGIPQSSEQHAATRMQALVKIVFKTPKQAVLKIEKVRFGYFNDKVAQPKYVHDFDLFEQVPLTTEKRELLEQPLEFSLEQGIVKSVRFTEQEQPWSANIKRAVLNLLQVNINKQRRTDSYKQSTSRYLESNSESMELVDEQEKKNQFFTVIEDTMEGECETAYTMTPVYTKEQQQVVNVTKTINFEKCERRPDIRYNHRFQDLCPTCQNKYMAKERNLQSSTVIRQQIIVGDNKQVLVKRAEAESMYTFAPFTREGSFVQTYVMTQLRLLKKQSVRDAELTSMRFPVESDSGLIYTTEYELIKEKYFLEGKHEQFEMEGELAYPLIKDKVEMVRQIAQKLAVYTSEEVSEEAPRQFVRLVKVMRTMSEKDIERLHEQFSENKPEEFTHEEHKKMKSIVVDTLAVSGTKNTIEHLVKKIEQGKFDAVKSAMLIRKLQSVRVISEEIIEKIWKLTSEEQCRENPLSVCQSAYLTVGSLLNGMCETKRDQYAAQDKIGQEHQTCTRQIKKQWTIKLIERFEKCHNDVCRITVLKALANAGLDQSANQLEQIIKSQKNSQIVRTEAILALRKLADIMPRKVEKILLPVFMSQRIAPAVRMTAMYTILRTQPPKYILDQITVSLQKEGDKQVAAFVYATLQEMANSTNPCEQRMANDLKLSLRHAAQRLDVNEWARRSQFMRAQLFTADGERGLTFDWQSLIGGNNTMLPKEIAASMQWNLANMWQRDAFTVGIKQQNVEKYLRRVARKYAHKLQNLPESLTELAEGRWSSEEENKETKYRQQLNDIFDDLSLESREFENEQREEESLAIVYMRLMNQEYGFLPIDKHVLPEQLREIFGNEQVSLKALLSRGERLLRSRSIELPFNVQSSQIYHEATRKIPTAMGLPVVMTSKSPIVAQARGTLKIKLDAEQKKVELECIECKPSMVMSMEDRVETWSPIVNTGVKIIFQAKFFMPINAKIEARMHQGEPQLRTVVKTHDKQYELIRVQTRPMTTVLVWPRALPQWQEPEQKTIVGEQSARINQNEYTIGEKALGVKLQAKYSWHHRPAHAIKSVNMAPLAGPNYFVVRVAPGHSMPQEIETTITGKLFNKMSSSLKPELSRFFESRSDEYLNDESRENEKSYERYYKNYESDKNTQHQIEVTVEGKGSSIERKAKLTVDCRVESTQQQAGKCELVIKRTPVPELERADWQLKSIVEFIYPERAHDVQELVEKERKLIVKANTMWGEQNQQEKNVEIKMVAEQSHAMRRLVKESLYVKHSQMSNEERRSLFSPVAQYEQIAYLSLLDELKIEADYEHVPAQLKNISEKALDLLKAYYYMQTEIDHQPSDKTNARNGQVRAFLAVDPVSRQMLNITIEVHKKPTEKVRVYDVPIPSAIFAYNTQRQGASAQNMYELISNKIFNAEENMCQVRSDRVKTFTGVQYMAPISTCYSLIAKDCTRQSQFAVLIKRVNERSEKKQLRIVTEQGELIVKPTSSDDNKLEFIYNGEKMSARQIEKVHGISLVEQQQPSSVLIRLTKAHVRVHFDGYAANVEASTMHRLCGLCGQLVTENIEPECELRDAENECVNAQSKKELKRLFKSYVLDKDECSTEQQKFYSEEEKYEYEPLQWQEQQYKNIDEQYNDDEYKREVSPVERTRVIEQLHEACFSKRPVLRCPKHTQPIEYQRGHIKVAYTCLDRNNFETSEYMRLAHQERVIAEVAELPASFTQTEKVPTKCEKINY